MPFLEIKIAAQVQTNLSLDVGNLTYKLCGVSAYRTRLNLKVLWSVFLQARKSVFQHFAQSVGGCKLWVYGGLETSV